MNRHLVETFQLNDELEEVEQFSHCVTIFVRQKQTQHGDRSYLVLSGQGWRRRAKGRKKQKKIMRSCCGSSRDLHT